ncbi:MAG: 3-coathanger stack domain-containing protein [Bacteroidota bacterium]
MFIMDGRERDDGDFCIGDDGRCPDDSTINPTLRMDRNDLIEFAENCEAFPISIRRECDGHRYTVHLNFEYWFAYVKPGTIGLSESNFTGRTELSQNVNLTTHTVEEASLQSNYEWEIFQDGIWQFTGITDKEAQLVKYLVDSTAAIGGYTFRRKAINHRINECQETDFAYSNQLTIYINDECDDEKRNVDFESGNLVSPPFFVNSTTSEFWIIDSIGANQSKYCLEVGFAQTPTEHIVSYLETSIQVVDSSNHTFINFDLTYDLQGKCIFLVDGNPLETFQGTDNQWNQHAYELSLSTGTHTLRWEYQKTTTDNVNPNEHIKLDNLNTFQTHPDLLPLLSLYYQTDGEFYWTNKSGWENRQTNSNCSPCSWYGVICDQSNRVVSLDLSANNLIGNIPYELGSLEELTLLNLSNNQLNGSIPNGLGSLSKLTTLKLHNNELTDSLPALMGNLSNLDTLFLQNNQLVGCFPSSYPPFCTDVEYDFSNNPNLSDFDAFCSSNECTICEHPDYQALKAVYDATGGPNWTENTGWSEPNSNQCDPCSWSRIDCDTSGRVIGLNLSQNNLVGTIPNEIGDLPELENLSFADNGVGLTGSLPSSIGNLSKLQWFYARNNNLTGNIPSSLGNLTNLLTFAVQSNNITGKLPPEIGNLTNLQVISLGDNNLIDPIPKEWGNLNNLQTLALQNNRLTGCFDPNLKNLCTTNLILLSGNNFINNNFTAFCSDDVGECTMECNNCEVIYLSSDTLTGDTTLIACDSILSQNDIVNTATETTDVMYQSGISIRLLPGFQVAAGATFIAQISDCNNLQSEEQPIIYRNKGSDSWDERITNTLKIFPNPFEYSTTVEFTLEQSDFIQLDLIDLTGRTALSVLTSSHYEAGTHQIMWQNDQLEAGIYWLRLLTPTGQVTQKVMVLR